MRIKLYAGLPGAASFNPLLPNGGDGTSGGTNGGPGVPPATPPAPAAPPAPTPPAAGAPATVGPHGYVENTPLEQLPVEQREAYWKHYAKTHRGERDELAAWKKANEARVAEYDALVAASRTDHERALETARTEAATAARTEGETSAAAKYVGPLVLARFESVLAGKKTPAEVATIVGGLNVGAFLGSDGLPDTEKVAAYAATIAPTVVTPPPNLGGGRTAPPNVGGTQAGVDAWHAAHPKKRPTTA
jgi:hypothetical protein